MILVCGATGELGGRVARLLLEQGVPVRALVRPQREPGFLQAGAAEVVHGDFREHESLDRAVRDVATVVSGVSAIGGLLGGRERRDGFRAVDRDGTIALIAAAERAGVRRFVFVSAAGIERARQTPMGEAKLAVEERLRRSPLQETIVRPDAFQETWLTPQSGLDWAKGKLTIFGRGDARSRYVSIADVATAVARWAVADDAPQRVEFGGPEAISRNEVADLIERHAGRPMKRRHVPRLALTAASRILKPVKPEIATLMGLGLMIDDGASWDDAPLRELGIEPRSASSYLAETVNGSAA